MTETGLGPSESNDNTMHNQQLQNDLQAVLEELRDATVEQMPDDVYNFQYEAKHVQPYILLLGTRKYRYAMREQRQNDLVEVFRQLQDNIVIVGVYGGVADILHAPKHTETIIFDWDSLEDNEAAI